MTFLQQDHSTLQYTAAQTMQKNAIPTYRASQGEEAKVYIHSKKHGNTLQYNAVQRTWPAREKKPRCIATSKRPRGASTPTCMVHRQYVDSSSSGASGTFAPRHMVQTRQAAWHKGNTLTVHQLVPAAHQWKAHGASTTTCMAHRQYISRIYKCGRERQ